MVVTAIWMVGVTGYYLYCHGSALYHAKQGAILRLWDSLAAWW